MCIIDRFVPPGGPGWAAPVRYVLFLDDAQQIALAQDHVLPVSYTHLRAHETVLDLVCRLLLEKKNNPHTTH